jgi:hypothetical protein
LVEAKKSSNEHVPYRLLTEPQIDNGNGLSFNTKRICGPLNEDVQVNFSQIICAPNGTWLDVRHKRLGFGGPSGFKPFGSLQKASVSSS